MAVIQHDEEENFYKIPDLEELKDRELFQDDNELKKEINKLNRKLKTFREEQDRDTRKLIKQHERALLNNSEFYEAQIEALREQNRQLFEKNHELYETSKIFVKGLEHLKNEGIRVTHVYNWNRKGVHGSLENRVKQLILDGKTIKSICPLAVDSHGYTLEALIITEHIEKPKKM